MSQDFEFTEQQTPGEPFKPVEKVPPAPPRPAPVVRTVEPDPLYRSPVSIGSGLLVTLALLGGLGYLGYDSYKTAPAPPADAPKAETGTPAPPASPEAGTAMPAAAPQSAAAGPALATEVADLHTALKAATARIDELAARPAPDVKALEARVAEAVKSGEGLAGLPVRLTALEDKIGTLSKPAEPASSPKVDALDKKVGELAAALDALKADVASARSAKPAMTTEPARPADAVKPADNINKADQAMTEAVDLFKQKKYAESLASFTKLQTDYPDDARVWYFSALANGLATRNWRGETERLVTLGVEKEKAGSPEVAKIDASFSGLTAINGKEWLAAYRARAASR